MEESILRAAHRRASVSRPKPPRAPRERERERPRTVESAVLRLENGLLDHPLIHLRGRRRVRGLRTSHSTFVKPSGLEWLHGALRPPRRPCPRRLAASVVVGKLRSSSAAPCRGVGRALSVLGFRNRRSEGPGVTAEMGGRGRQDIQMELLDIDREDTHMRLQALSRLVLRVHVIAPPSTAIQAWLVTRAAGDSDPSERP